MGIDWVVLDKEENGRTIDPWMTLGARRLDLQDPETVAAFRAIYDHRLSLVDPPTVRKWWQFGAAEPKERRAFREYWSRPFQAVLADAAAEKPPPVMIECAPGNEDGLAAICGAARTCDFRGNELREEFNAVVREMGLDDTPFWNDMSIAEMRQVADDLEAALARYRAETTERDAESEETVVAGVRWLRYWAGKGHAVTAWT